MYISSATSPSIGTVMRQQAEEKSKTQTDQETGKNTAPEDSVHLSSAASSRFKQLQETALTSKETTIMGTAKYIEEQAKKIVAAKVEKAKQIIAGTYVEEKDKNTAPPVRQIGEASSNSKSLTANEAFGYSGFRPLGADKPTKDSPNGGSAIQEGSSAAGGAGGSSESDSSSALQLIKDRIREAKERLTEAQAELNEAMAKMKEGEQGSGMEQLGGMNSTNIEAQAALSAAQYKVAAANAELQSLYQELDSATEVSSQAMTA